MIRASCNWKYAKWKYHNPRNVCDVLPRRREHASDGLRKLPKFMPINFDTWSLEQLGTYDTIVGAKLGKEKYIYFKGECICKRSVSEVIHNNCEPTTHMREIVFRKARRFSPCWSLVCNIVYAVENVQFTPIVWPLFG